MALDKCPYWSEKKIKTLQYSVPWDNVIEELYKTYTPKDIFNFMETGELSYAVNMIDETKPHGLDALWLYGSNRLEDFLKDYNVCFYRDSLSNVLGRGINQGSSIDRDTTDNKKRPEVASKRKLSIPDATKWLDVFVRVVINERIEIEYRNDFRILTYIELGLDKKPALKKLLESFVRNGFFKYNSAERANISNLRKIFKDLFPKIKEDPLPKDSNTWKPAFRILTSESK